MCALVDVLHLDVVALDPVLLLQFGDGGSDEVDLKQKSRRLIQGVVHD